VGPRVLLDLLNPFWTRNLVLHSSDPPDLCRQNLRRLGGAPFGGPAYVRVASNGTVVVQRCGWGNNGWRPQARVVIAGDPAGDSVLRVRLGRRMGVRVWMVGWPLVCLWISLQGVDHALDDPVNFLSGLVVFGVLGQAFALLIALVWDHEPDKLVDLIVSQLRGVEGVPTDP
jgi:hypothetical protein